MKKNTESDLSEIKRAISSNPITDKCSKQLCFGCSNRANCREIQGYTTPVDQAAIAEDLHQRDLSLTAAAASNGFDN